MTDKKTILISISNFCVGGAQRQLVRLLESVDYSRFKVNLVVFFDCKGSKSIVDHIPDSVVVYEMGYRRLLDVSAIIKTAGLIKGIKPDLVMSSLFHSNLILRLLRLRFWYPIITREHNTHYKKGFLELWADRILAPLSSRVVCVSDEVRELTVKQQWLPKKKCNVIYNGINFSEIEMKRDSADGQWVRSELGINNNDLVAVYVGRLAVQKRVYKLVELFAKRAVKNPTDHLVIVGFGRHLESLKKLVLELGLKNNIHLVGMQDNPFPYYAAADAFISLSQIEGMSNTHLEALAFDLPIITTPTGGTKAIVVHKQNGYIIDETSSEKISDSLDWVHSLNMKTVKDINKEIKKKFLMSNNVSAYQTLWLDLINNRN